MNGESVNGSSELGYPNGWFAVAFSDDLKARSVVRRKFMGDELVLWRTRSGKIGASRAHCPHLGAHLGYGGKVADENIICPFHGFSFGLDGSCVATPYGTPPRARLDTLTAAETNGLVMVWHHGGGIAPAWDPPADAPQYGYSHFVTSKETIKATLQDGMENVVDSGHLPAVHGFSWHGKVNDLRFDGHRCTFHVETRHTLPGFGSITFGNKFELDGLGILRVLITQPHMRMGVRVWTVSSPIDKSHLDVRFMVSARLPALSAIAVYPLFAFIHRQLRMDYKIWAHKAYLPHPKLSPEDGPIMPFRRWAKSLYS